MIENDRNLLSGASVPAQAVAAALPPAPPIPDRMVSATPPVTIFASVFVGAEEGCVKKRNVDVESSFIPLELPPFQAAFAVDSLRSAWPTPVGVPAGGRRRARPG